MGVVIIESNTKIKINLQINSFGGNIRQHMNIIKIIKNSNKDIVATVDFCGSCGSGFYGSWINNRLNNMSNG